MRFSCANALKSCALPESKRSWPGFFFSVRISSIRFPLMSFEPGPLDLLQGGRDHVLGHGVHLFAEFARAWHRRPRGRKALVCVAPQQERVACLELLPFELPGLIVEERAGPLARLFEDPVE